MAEIEVEGISYYYELHGNGTPLVFIAGFGANHTVWRYVYPAFIDRHQVLLFDNPASGRTRDKETALTVESMAAGVAGLIDRLELREPCIVGHSMGGSIAQILALKYPEKVGRLVIVNSVSRWDGRTMMAIKGLIDIFKSRVPLDSQLNINLPWLFGKKALGDRDRTAALRAMILDNPTPPTIKEMERQYRALAEFDSSDSLGKINVPVLVVISEEDILAPPAESEEMARNISGARIVRIPGAHASEYEEPEELVAAIRSFLA